ncbi:MAG: OsmC family protein [Crocinitomicaceae bacterium]|nr:OsmC family protein [Crocinitomicaceae bacterium]
MGQSIVSGELKQGYTVVNSVRSHQWISDEPAEDGGLDLGAKPTELLLSSLISCKLITIQMYASRKSWNVDGVKVHLNFAGGDDKTIIEKKIEYTSNLTEEQQNRLTQISGRCPVVKMLSNSIEFKLI